MASSLPDSLPLLLALLQEGAPAEAPPQGLGGTMLVPMLLIGVIFWFVLISPERKTRKKREALLAALKKGDKVMTTSGLFGAVAQVQDDVVTLQVADGVRMRFSRQAIQDILNEDSSKEGSEPSAQPTESKA